MIRLNDTATNIFMQLVAKLEGVDHVRFDNSGGSFMAVVVEKLEEAILVPDIKISIYSLAHYLEQNGDLIPDPEMTFGVSHELCKVWPLTFQNQLSYHKAVQRDAKGKWGVYVKYQDALASFAETWLDNIRVQQDL